MERVAGLGAVALAGTGLGVVTRRADGRLVTNTLTLARRGRRAESPVERRARIEAFAAEIDYTIGPVALVVIAGPAPPATAADSDRLRSAVLARLAARGVPVAVCPPATVAQLVRTDPAAVIAVVLAQLGATWCGWAAPALECHRAALPGITWPAGLHRERGHACGG